MKMLAAEYIGARVIPSHNSPLGQLILDQMPDGPAFFAGAIRRIEHDFTNIKIGGESDFLGFTEPEYYIEWYAKELGFQYPDAVIELFGWAESDNFENAYIDTDEMERWITVAQQAAIYRRGLTSKGVL